MILNQILLTVLKRNVWKSVCLICMWILGLKDPNQAWNLRAIILILHLTSSQLHSLQHHTFLANSIIRVLQFIICSKKKDSKSSQKILPHKPVILILLIFNTVAGVRPIGSWQAFGYLLYSWKITTFPFYTLNFSMLKQSNICKYQ